MANIHLKDIESDYGSEFDTEDEAIIATFLSQSPSLTSASVSIASIERHASSSSSGRCTAGLLSAVIAVEGVTASVGAPRSSPSKGPLIEVEYDTSSRDSWIGICLCHPPYSVIQQLTRLTASSTRDGSPSKDSTVAPPLQPEPLKIDTRSPIRRFRTKPMKPLSVTDLVSPAWCELQYWYALTKFGRVPPTKAMRKGSAVHKVLEEQVHEIVPVKVTTKEDAFGLRIWNVIQGLRCLRATGLTRELEVWGIIDGEVVIGVIDELSYSTPSPESEHAGQRAPLTKRTNPNEASHQAHAEDLMYEDPDLMDYWLGGLEPDKTVYITDVKTRGYRSLPSGAALRQTCFQLMLYRKLLVALASNTVDADAVFNRYSLRLLEPFSPTFIAEVSATESVVLETTPSQEDGTETTTSGLGDHSNLSALWSLMISEFQRTVPPTSVSSSLRAEYRWSRTGEVIGSHSFDHDDAVLEPYLASELSWWKGEREARGVEVEDAFKCQICQFADGCTWRKAKVEEAALKQRLRRAGRSKSTV